MAVLGPPTTGCLRKTKGVGGYKTRYPVQGERALVTGLYYTKLLHKGLLVNYYSDLEKYTKPTMIQVKILYFNLYLLILIMPLKYHKIVK